MQHTIGCPECKRRLVLPAGLDDLEVQCPSCRARFTPYPSMPGSATVGPTESSGPPDESPPDPAADRQPVPDFSNPTAKKPATKSGGGAVAWIVIVILIAIGRWIFSEGAHRQQRYDAIRPDGQFRNPDGMPKDQMDLLMKSLAATRAIKLDKLPMPDTTAKEFQPLFDALGRDLRAADGRRVISHFEVERMAEEFLALKLIPEKTDPEKREFVQALHRSLTDRLERDATGLAWTSLVIPKVERLPNDEAVVVTQLVNTRGETRRVRWWLVRRGGGWRIFDLEDPYPGLRLSLSAGLGVP